MANLPRISVVTPSYNQGCFLEECIRSVLDQGYPNLEYIIIDGGSTDGSVDVIRKYQDRLAFWVSERDEGQADAINKGCRRATGELVAWLNSDDYYLPGSLETVAKAHTQNPQASFYFGDGCRVDASGRTLGKFFPDGKVLFGRGAMIYGLNTILQPATFMNRSHLVQVNYLDPELHWGLDTDLWIRLSQRADPVPVQAVLAASREYGATKTSTGSFRRIEELRRIAEKHGGLPMTPGVLCYFLATLHQMSVDHEDVFPGVFRTRLKEFWEFVGLLMAKYGAHPDGFLRAPPAHPARRYLQVLWNRPVPEEVLADSTRPRQAPESADAEEPRILSLASARAVREKPLRIAIDLRHVTLGSSGGVALLLKGVLEALFARHPEQEFHLFTTIFNRGLLERLPDNVHCWTFPVEDYFADIDLFLMEKQIDVLFCGFPNEKQLRFPLARQVVMIPDIQHEIYPEFFDLAQLRGRRAAFNRVLGRAGAVGTISGFARQTLLDHEWTRCPDIFLMSPALSVTQPADPEALSGAEKALLPAGDFFLYPANLWPHKNHRRVLQAFGQFLKESGRAAALVLTGHPEGWPALQQEFPDLPVRHLGFVRPQLLSVLLARARALVFFSLYEGFGMPLLDAFHAGTPVICSNTTSLPEVGGDAALSCDPTDAAAMSALMARVCTDESLRAELSSRGKERLAAYTWERSAENLFQALRRVADRAGRAEAEAPTAAEDDLPLVTIVTPSYNQGEFLKRTIDSVLAQTYPNIEYIVMDGGSKDDSVEILKSYGDRFRWVSEPDGGQTDAINKGFARSHGQIRTYLNSDDVLAPDAVARVVDYFRRHPDCDLAYGRGAYIDKEDRVTGLYQTLEYSFEELMSWCCICQPAAFWRTRIAGKVGPFNDRLNYAMDYEYWLRIDRAGGRIEHLHDLLAFSRLYAETKTLSARRQVYREIFAVCQQHGGYVHFNNFKGLWHYLCWEKESGWPRRFRRLPGFSEKMARLHHAWYHRRQYSWPRLARAAARRGKRLLLGVARLALRLPGKLLGRAVQLVKGRSARPVQGFWPDNWLEPTCSVSLKGRPVGQDFRLAGTAPVDMTLRVQVAGKVVGTYPLQANKYEHIRFRVEADAGERLVLHFSGAVTDATQRRVSFFVQDTNLFMEHEVA
jgi:glycosyltransferase involved in cell wall biosynthesis